MDGPIRTGLWFSLRHESSVPNCAPGFEWLNYSLPILLSTAYPLGAEHLCPKVRRNDEIAFSPTNLLTHPHWHACLTTNGNVLARPIWSIQM